jgi:hypothetical protein
MKTQAESNTDQQQHDANKQQGTYQPMNILADALWFVWHTLEFRVIIAGRRNLMSGLSRGSYMGKYNEKKVSNFVRSSMFFIGKTK